MHGPYAWCPTSHSLDPIRTHDPAAVARRQVRTHNTCLRRPLTLRNRPVSDPTDSVPFGRGIDSPIRYADYMELNKAAGVVPGLLLGLPGAARAVQVRDGTTHVKNGTYLAEGTAGYSVYEAESMDAAIALAALPTKYY